MNLQDQIFDELLDVEVRVNLTKLREAARLGIPPAYRAQVYRYLLGISYIDKSTEMTLERSQEHEFERLINSPLSQMWLGRAVTSSAINKTNNCSNSISGARNKSDNFDTMKSKKHVL